MARPSILFTTPSRSLYNEYENSELDKAHVVCGETAELSKKNSIIWHGADLGGPDPEQERDPPPEATPITFPPNEPREGRAWTDDSPPPQFRSLFSKVLKPTDITDRHAQALNITVHPLCSVDELLPLNTDGESYLPSVESEQSTGVSSADGSAPDPAVARRQKDLEERLAELKIDNDLAFRVLNKNMTQGVKPPRLAYMRKFWEGLESMCQYWDCSLDEYFESVEPSPSDEQTTKRQRLDAEPMDASNAHDASSSIVDKVLAAPEDLANENQQSNGNSGSENNSQDSALIDGDAVMDDDNRRTRESSATPEPRAQMRYKGRRTATGRAMPDQFRVDMVKGFVEGTIWPFRTSLSPPRMMPIVQFEKLNLPVRQTAAVYRLPNDRMKARQGWLEGPVLSVQARSDTDFLNEDGSPIEDKSRLDFMREIGGLLQLAQERQREGRSETKPGEGKWWTTTPRWGGGPGGEVENEYGNSDIVAAAEEVLEAGKNGNEKKEKDASKSRKKKTPAMLWKELKPGRGYWDPKTTYTAIGTRPESDYDDVFLVSSLNHHVSIIRMTIHGQYMDYVTSSVMPNPLPADADWCTPQIRRSHWFDLFDKEERLEAFRGLWGVMAYLTRLQS